MAKKDKKEKKAAKKEAKAKAAVKSSLKSTLKPTSKSAQKPLAEKSAKKSASKPVAKLNGKASPKISKIQKVVKKAAIVVTKNLPSKGASKTSASFKENPKKVIKAESKSKSASAQEAEIAKAPKASNHTMLSRPVKSTAKMSPFVEKQKQRLIDLRDHILDQMHGVAQDTLRVKAEGSEASAFGMHQADAGSDAYDKDFALSLLSQEQDALYEIEEALKRIDAGTYGTCEMSNKIIPKVRLEAIPHARFTVECQAQLERENKGRRRWDTVPQFMDSAESLVDEDDDGAEEDDRRKEKD